MQYLTQKNPILYLRPLWWVVVSILSIPAVQCTQASSSQTKDTKTSSQSQEPNQQKICIEVSGQELEDIVMQVEHDQKNRQSLISENKNLQSALKKLNTSHGLYICQLRHQLLRKDITIDSLKLDLSYSIIECDYYKNQTKMLQDHVQHVLDLVQKVENHQGYIDNLNHSLVVLETENLSLRNKINRYENRMVELVAENVKLSDEICAKDKRICALNKEVEAQRKVVVSQKKKYRMLMDKFAVSVDLVSFLFGSLVYLYRNYVSPTFRNTSQPEP